MSTVSSAVTVTSIPSARPVFQRWAGSLINAWKAWRAQVILDREMRALEGLSDATLRDLGLAERAMKRPTLSGLDYERSRW